MAKKGGKSAPNTPMPHNMPMMKSGTMPKGTPMMPGHSKMMKGTGDKK